METLKIEFTEIGEDYVVCRMPVTSDVHQPAGILHGGATAALVETAGSFASRYFIKDEESITLHSTTQNRVNMVYSLSSSEDAYHSNKKAHTNTY